MDKRHGKRMYIPRSFDVQSEFQITRNETETENRIEHMAISILLPFYIILNVEMTKNIQHHRRLSD